jgi:hypothetical protein
MVLLQLNYIVYRMLYKGKPELNHAVKQTLDLYAKNNSDLTL